MKFYQGESSNVNNVNLTKECRYKLIMELYNLCHKHTLWVSIKKRRHPWTRKKNSPINFWDYEKG